MRAGFSFFNYWLFLARKLLFGGDGFVSLSFFSMDSVILAEEHTFLFLLLFWLEIIAFFQLAVKARNWN